MVLDQVVESVVERVGSAYLVVERKSKSDVTTIAIVREKGREGSCAKRIQMMDVTSSFDKNLTKVLLAMGKLKHG